MRRCLINRTWTGLRCDHSPLWNDRLLRRGLGCSRRRSARRRWCCRFRGRLSRNRRLWSRLSRRRCYYHCRWSSGFFGCSRSGRRRNRWRCGFCRRRCNDNGSFRSWCYRFWRNHCGLFLRGRRRTDRRCGRCGLRWWRGRTHRRRRCRPGLRSWGMMLLLFALAQQTSDIARLGNLGEIDLRLDLGSSRVLLLGDRGGLGEMLPYLFRFIVFKRA